MQASAVWGVATFCYGWLIERPTMLAYVPATSVSKSESHRLLICAYARCIVKVSTAPLVVALH